jgi:hypothetical protein
MNRRLTLAVAGAITAGALVLSGVAVAGGAAATRVTIRGPQGDFQGKIFSASDSCLGERRVTVFMMHSEEPTPSADMRIASDTSEQNGNRGEWSVGNTGFRDGVFYAKVARSPGCKGDLSPTIELVDGEPQ